MRTTLLPAIVLLLAGCVTTASDGFLDVIEVTDETTRLSCWDGMADGSFGSRIGRSGVVVGPTGHRAYTEVHALALAGRTPDMRSCQNISTLYLATGPEGEFRPLFQQRPGGEGRNGNSITIVDFSPDGSRIMANLDTWTYRTEIDSPLVIVLDIEGQRTGKLDAAAAVRQRFGDDCSFHIEGAGFADDGSPLIRITPPAGRDDGEPCVAQPLLARYNVAMRTVDLAHGDALRRWSSAESDDAAAGTP